MPSFIRSTKIEGLEYRSEDNSRSLEFSFSSETPVERWFGSEILEHKAESIDFTRLKETGTLLFNHNRDYVLGKIEDAWLDEASKKCRVRVVFDKDEESEKIYSKVKSGSLRGVSFGYLTKEYKNINNKEGRMIGRTITKWEPYEVSIVSIPADTEVGIGRSHEEGEREREEMSAEKKKTNESEVNEKNKTSENENSETTGKEEGEETKKVKTGEKECNSGESKNKGGKRSMPETIAVAEEQKRCLTITKLCREHNVNENEMERFISEGTSVDEVREFILDGMKENKKPISIGVEVRETGRENFERDMSDALLLRSGISLIEENKEAEKFTGVGFRDIAIRSLAMNGIDASMMNNDELFKRALTPGSAFQSVMDNTVNKSMLKAYQSTPTTFQEWTATGSQTNFKGATHYQISEAGTLKKINEGGEFEFDEMTDSKVKTYLATFGKGFGLTRNALINDDLDVLTRIPQAYVRAAYRGINKLVYSILAGNGKIYDNKNLFDTSHKNDATIKGAPTVETIGEMRKLMRTQKNLGGKETLNIPMKYILVPAALETKAEQLINSTADPAGNNSGVVNPFRNKLQIIAEPELDAYSETTWYGIADKNVVESIMVSYLNGKKTPTLESQVAFETLGIKYRIFMDYGVDVIDYRGLVRNEGAEE